MWKVKTSDFNIVIALFSMKYSLPLSNATYLYFVYRQIQWKIKIAHNLPFYKIENCFYIWFLLM